MFRNIILILLLITQTVPAQTVAETPGASHNAQRKEYQSRIGVNSAKPYNLTMQEAIALALENNRDIEVERIGVQRREFDLAAAKGIFDPAMAINFAYQRRNTPVTSLLAGGNDGKLENSDLSSSTTFAKRLPWQGGDIKMTVENNRLTSDNLFNSLEPEYRSALSFEFSQPLFRNRSIDSARRQIRLKVNQLNLSDLQFRQRIIDIITQVKNAYWDLVFAYRDEEIKRESVELAETQLAYNQRLVDKGVLAPSDVISARVEIERRTDEAEAALQAVQRAENNLKALMLQPSQAELWNAMLLPVDQPQVELPQPLPLDEALKVAFQLRPEMKQFQVRSEMNKIDVEYYRNQGKPEVNFIAAYTTTGLAGTTRKEDNPLQMINEPFFARINQLSQIAGLPVIAATNNSIDSKLIGGYGQSLSNLFSNRYNSWQVGLNINFSWGNHTAKAELGQALATGRQVDVERERTQQAIEVEVRNLLQAVNSAYRRVQVAHNSQVDALMQYQAEERKFEAGISTNYLILDRQNALSAARGRELKAITDYNKAFTDLQRALSTTLTDQNIEVTNR